jgi:predicted transcriptional regulator of viral defense system
MYRFADMPTLGNPDIATVALKVPKGVICLISALSWHEMTSEIPHEIYLALPRGAEPPRLEHPPLRIFWFQGAAFAEGVEEHVVDGNPVRIYSPEKTLADSFKYRNKIGLDVVLEALKLYRRRKRFKVDELMHFAPICRMEKVMRPFLEATL